MQMNNINHRKNITRSLLATIVLLISMLVQSSAFKVHDSSIKVIVLDAGHGGKDRGCLSVNGVKEKDLTLELTKRIGKMIEDSLKAVKVIYTRSDDTYVSLDDRASIANDNDAVLFVSIHGNAHHNSAMHGAETFVMGLHKEADHKSVCMKEGILANNDDSVLETVLSEQKQVERLGWSVRLASRIQDNVRSTGDLSDLGVNQAGFVVLWKTTMPSVLVETGYLTNLKDERYLTSSEGKNETAYNIFEAVKELYQD